MSDEIDFPKLDKLNLQKELVKKLTEASNLIKSTSAPFRVISHYDADGLTAGAIICAVLLRLGKQFHTSLCHNLEPESEIYNELAAAQSDVKIFSDLGSGQLEVIEGLAGWSIILDHHKPPRDSSANNLIHINAHNFGLNGSYEISAATLAFLLAITINSQNWDLISLALAGAIGDKQHKNGFKGVNQSLVTAALATGLLEEETTIKLSGKTILDAITRSTDPYIVGLSNNRSAVNELLKSLHIDPEARVEDLDDEQIQRLASYLVLKLLEQGIPPEDAEELITTKLYTKKSKIELEELSHQINACGRMDKMGIGVAVGLGDGWAIEYAKKLRNEYKSKIREGLKRLEETGLKELKNVQYFYESKPELAGTFAGIGMMYFFNQSKPVIALTKTDKNIKVSGRGTKRMVSRGLDLASVLSTSATELSGTGGGHNIAAGATIPLDTDKKFLERVDELVGEQLNSNKSD